MMLSRSGWRSPPGNCALPEDEVHVWRTTLDWPAQSAMELESILSPDERERVVDFRAAGRAVDLRAVERAVEVRRVGRAWRQ